MSFIETPAQARAISITASALASTSLCMCLVILGSSLWIWTYPRARTQLNRLSFRLLLWALGAQVVYDITHIVLFAPTDRGTGTVLECQVGMAFRVAMLSTVNYLITCIAVNLMLTIVFGISPLEYHLEWVYIGTSFFLGILVPVIAASLNHFGWDPIFEVCYFTSADDDVRIRHFIVDLYLWQGITIVIAFVSVVWTLCKLFSQSRRTRMAANFDTISSALGVDSGSAECPHGSRRGSIVSASPLRRFFNSKQQCGCSTITSQTTIVNRMTLYQLQDKLIGVALRISLYPITLIVINLFITIGDVFTAVTHGVHSREGFYLTALHRSLCGARGIFFAALCIFVDPCLLRGFKMAREERRQRKQDQAEEEGRLNEKPRRAPSSAFGTPRCDDEKLVDGQLGSVPQIAYIDYSPTHTSSGEVPPELLASSLVLPEAAGARPTFGSDCLWSFNSSIGDGSRSTEGSAESTTDPDVPVNSSALATARGSTASMDFVSFLQLEPESIRPIGSAARAKPKVNLRHPAASPPSAPAWQSANVFSMPAPLPATIDETSDADGVDPGGPDLTGAASASSCSPSARRRSACSRGRDARRKDSELSCDLAQALAMGYVDYQESSTRPASGFDQALDRSTTLEVTHTDPPSVELQDRSQSRTIGQKKASLPQLWKAAFEQGPRALRASGATLTAGPRVGEEGNREDTRGWKERSGQRKDEMARRERLRKLEELYEEAEAQL